MTVKNKKIEAYPTSFAQKRIYFLENLEMGRIRNNIGVMSRFHQIFSVEYIKKILAMIIDRHEAFRYNFRETENGELVQFVNNKGVLDFQYFDLRGSDVSETMEKKQKIIEEAMDKKFNLENDALVRFVVIKISDLEHEFLVVAHHIIADAWSLSIAANEFFHISQALFYGQEINLPVLPIQYKDYAAWEQSEEFLEKIAKQSEYWLEHFAGELPVLDIPTDFPRPLWQSYQTEMVSVEIAADNYKRINDFCAKYKITPYVFALGAFTLLLYKLSGQNDFIVGTFSANRDLPELDNVVGIFLNNLPIRTKFNEEENILEYFIKLQETVLKSMENKDYPFEKLIEDLEVNRDMSRAPIFNTVFQMFNSGGHNDLQFNIFQEQILEYSTFDKTLGKFDISFHIHDRKNDWLLAMTYDRRLFKKESIERYLNYYQNIIKNILEDAEKKIDKLLYIDEAEKNEILIKSSGEIFPLENDLDIYAYFSRQAQLDPEKTALIFNSDRISYKKFLEKVDLAAASLSAFGLKPGDRLGFCLERSIDYVAGLLAALKLGIVYVPLALDFPQERIDFIVKDAEISYVLVSEKKSFSGAETILVEDLLKGDNYPEPLLTNPRPDKLAAIIYTSGSTGSPKGVLISEKGLINQAWAKIKFLEISPADIIVQNLPATFVASLWQFFSPLFIGGSILLVSDDDNRNLPAMIDLLCQEKITIWETVPSLFSWFISIGKNPELFSETLKIVLTGEATPEYLVREFFRKYKFRLYNAYGQTECSDDTLMSEINQDNFSKVLLGRPLINTEVYILDTNKSLLPINVVGELYISGAGLSSAYNKLPEKTNEVFVAHPFFPNRKIFKTGDLGRYLPSGEIEYLGRIDQQIKLQGRRVELGEIENRLADFPGIKQSLVIKNSNGLILYYTGAELTAKGIYNFLKRFLPAYMLPKYYIPLPSFPLNRSGKIEKKLLPIPNDNFMVKAGVCILETKTEKELAKIWKKLLAIKEVGREDDFFALGGYSLLAGQMVFELRKHGFSVSLPDIFRYSQLASLAEYLEKNISPNPVLPGGRPLTIIGDYLRKQQKGWQINEGELNFFVKNLNQEFLNNACRELQKNFPEKNIDLVSLSSERGVSDMVFYYDKEKENLKIIRDKKKIKALEFSRILMKWQKFYNQNLLGANNLVFTPFCSYPEYYHCIHASFYEIAMAQTQRFFSSSLAPAFDYFILPNYCLINDQERRDNDFNALLLGKPSIYMSAKRLGIQYSLNKVSDEQKAKTFLKQNHDNIFLLIGNNYYLPSSSYYHRPDFIDYLNEGRNLVSMNYSIFQENGDKIYYYSANLNCIGQIDSEDFIGYWLNFKNFNGPTDPVLDFSFHYINFRGMEKIPEFRLSDYYEVLLSNIEEYFRSWSIVGGPNFGFKKIFFGKSAWEEYCRDIRLNLSGEENSIADITIIDMFKRLEKPNLFLKDLLNDIAPLNDDFVVYLDDLSIILSDSDKIFEKLYKFVKESKIEYEPIITLLPSAAARSRKFLTRKMKEDLIEAVEILMKKQESLLSAMQARLKTLI